MVSNFLRSDRSPNNSDNGGLIAQAMLTSQLRMEQKERQKLEVNVSKTNNEL